jgi:hypothetical protein
MENNSRETAEPVDKNSWMGNNPNSMNSRYTFKTDVDLISNKKNPIMFNKSAEDSISNETTSFKKKQEISVVYKGMPYEEWTKIRDQFLKNHNML